MVLDLRDSGEIYSIEAIPLATRSIASERSTGLRSPLMVTASTIPFSARLSTWSFIRDCRGEMITVRPLEVSPAISAGSWNVIDLPPPVGKIARRDLPLTATLAAIS